MLKYHIQTVELTSAQSTISFNSIPQDFTDLVMLLSLRTTTTGRTDGWEDVLLIQNGFTTGVSLRQLYGVGSGSGASNTSTTAGGGFATHSAMTANTFSNTSIYFPNYRSTTNKPFSIETVTEQNATSAIQVLTAGLITTTSPLTSLGVSLPANSFAAGSSISLYGVRRGDDRVTKVSPVAVGGTVTTSGGSTIHTFNSSGTFVANKEVEVEYLVVAGGGGSTGYDYAMGAGGAGGYRCSVQGELSGGGSPAEPKLSIVPGPSYAVTVGAGGSGNTTNGGLASAGSNSSLGTIISLGGGRGGSSANGDSSGGNGGSGGGSGSSASPFPANGGSGTIGQGFNGGTVVNGYAVANYPGGGGGGAGATGGNPPASNTGGAGGGGVTSSITGSSVTRAGGGGAAIYAIYSGGSAGTGGAGGGGNGGIGFQFNGTDGTTNTGGGAGGSGAGQNGRAGGSGVVIIRYLTP
jgi:hypothetical protein